LWLDLLPSRTDLPIILRPAEQFGQDRVSQGTHSMAEPFKLGAFSSH
jgi:hypothetical protein